MAIDLDAILHEIGPAMGRFKPDESLSAFDATFVPPPEEPTVKERILAGKFTIVTGPDQIGKSTFKNRLMGILDPHRFDCSNVEVMTSGYENASTAEWYYSYLDQVCRVSGLNSTLKEWWATHPQFEAGERVRSFFEDVLLPHYNDINKDLVIFIDDFDLLPSQLEKYLAGEEEKNRMTSHEFFSHVAGFHRLRESKEDFNKVVFVALGNPAKTRLIKELSLALSESEEDVERTVQDLVVSLGYLDLEASKNILVTGFDHLKADKIALIAGIFEWSGGQPYLTQKICHTINRERSQVDDVKETVATTVRYLFKSEGAADDRNLQAIQQRLDLIDDRYRLRTLEQYRNILRSEVGIPVSQLQFNADLERQDLLKQGTESELLDTRLQERREVHNEVMALLPTLGLIRIENDRYQVGNRIYADRFDLEWIDRLWKDLDRPYYNAMKAWLSNPKNNDLLLKGPTLKDAIKWAAGRDDLTQDEKDFIDASSDLERRLMRTQLLIRSALTILFLLLSIVAVYGWWKSFKNSQVAETFAKKSEKASVNAMAESRLSNDLAVIASCSAERARNSAEEARKNAKKAEENAQRAEKNAKDAEAARADAESKRILADSLRNVAELAKKDAIRKAAEELRLKNLAKAQSLAFKSTQYFNQPSINGLLALEAYRLDRANNGENPRDPAIYEALRSAIAELDPRTLRNITLFADDIEAFTVREEDRLFLLSENGNYGTTAFQKTIALRGKDDMNLLSKGGAPINKAFIFPEKNVLVVGYEDKTASYWDIGKEKPVELVLKLKEPTGRLRAVSIDFNNSLIATGGRDNTIRIWSIGENGMTIKSTKPLKASIRSLAFLDDGRKIISGDESGTIKLWEVIDGKLRSAVDSFIAPARNISAEMISKDNTIAVGYSDGTIKVIAVDKNGYNAFIRPPKTFSSGINVGVEYLAIDTRKNLLASANADATIKIYSLDESLSSNRPIIIYDHRRKVDGLEFNVKSQIYALCRDNSIRRWETDLEVMAKQLKSLIEERVKEQNKEAQVQEKEGWQSIQEEDEDLNYKTVWKNNNLDPDLLNPEFDKEN